MHACYYINLYTFIFVRRECQLRKCIPPPTPEAPVSTSQSTPETPLQSQTTTVPLSTADPDWSDQDLTVLGLLFGPLWQKAKECEMSSKPHQFKSAGMRKLMQTIWKKTCDLDLNAGEFTTERKKTLKFDGAALLDLVGKYRANPKARTQFRGRVQHAVKVHYDSLPSAYQPRDKSMPLHQHWTMVRNAIRPPPPPRQQLMRDATAKTQRRLVLNDTENQQ